MEVLRLHSTEAQRLGERLIVIPVVKVSAVCDAREGDGCGAYVYVVADHKPFGVRESASEIAAMLDPPLSEAPRRAAAKETACPSK